MGPTGDHLSVSETAVSAAQGDVAASGAAARSEGLSGDTMRDTGRPVSEPDGVPRRGGDGRPGERALALVDRSAALRR